MKIKPTGTTVLVKVDNFEEVTEGGIVLTSEYADKEQAVIQTATVVAIGPCAFVGWRGCESPMYYAAAKDYLGDEKISDSMCEALLDKFKWNDPDYPPHKQWGIDIGSKVEFKKFDGKKSVVEGHEDYLYIPDTQIIGVIEDE